MKSGKIFLLGLVLAMGLQTSLPAEANNGNNAAMIGGILGGLAAGAIIAGAANHHHGPPPPPPPPYRLIEKAKSRAFFAPLGRPVTMGNRGVMVTVTMTRDWSMGRDYCRSYELNISQWGHESYDRGVLCRGEWGKFYER